MRILTKPYQDSGHPHFGNLTVVRRDAAFAKLREIVALSNAPARFGQKGKRSRLEKSPT